MGSKGVAASKSAKVKLRYFLYSTPVEILVYLAIALSVGTLAIEIGWQDLANAHQVAMGRAETGFTAFFVVEYLAKLLVADRRWHFVRTNVIDLLAILPFLRFFRLLRGVRILRLLRLLRLLRMGSMITRRLSMLEGAKNIREVLIVVTVFLAALLGGAIGITLFERNVPDTGFQSLGDGLWWTIVTLTTVGYGDLFPKTVNGRILGALLMLVGLSFYGLVAGLGSNFIITRLKKGGEWMVSTFSNHTVILGVNDKLDRIVSILLKRGERIVIVTDDIDRVKHYPENVTAVIEGDFVERATMIKARVEHAANVIILADTNGRSARDADARAVLATLGVERLKPEIRSIVEALSSETAYHLENAGVDEIVRSGDLTAEMLAYSTDHPDYTDGLGAMMRFVHKHPILTENVPARLHGKSLRAASKFMNQQGNILLAIVDPKGNETVEPTHRVRRKDRMIFVSVDHYRSEEGEDSEPDA